MLEIKGFWRPEVSIDTKDTILVFSKDKYSSDTDVFVSVKSAIVKYSPFNTLTREGAFPIFSKDSRLISVDDD